MHATARQFARFLYRRTLPAGAKNTLQLFLLWDRADTPPRGITEFGARRVLVLAPHMDDEVIGCGGALRCHVLAGAPVTVVFLTDGSAGDPALRNGAVPAAQRAAARRQLTAQRKEESRRACGHLGVGDLRFWDAPDGALAVTPALTARLAALLTAAVPDVVYVPALLDTHRDHWAANQLLAAALAGAAGWCTSGAVIRQYEAWTPLLVNVLADITGVFAAKQAALREFASQNRHVDYVHTTTGLNAYRAVHRQQGAGYAEAFYESTPRVYLELMARSSVRA
jgi:LmbE family N-acetylglucosaminyl deacetylase